MTNRKILVVDDNPIILKTLTTKLEQKGFAVCTAADGGQAIGAIRREKPDFLVLDLMFPPDVSRGGGVPWDGFLILDFIRRMPEGHTIPFVVISRSEKAADKERATRMGALDFLDKPVDVKRLVNLIDVTLNSNPKEAALAGPA